MKILYVPLSMASVNEYIVKATPVNKSPLYSHLIEEQGRLFNFLYSGCEKLESSLLPTLEPVALFKSLFQFIDSSTAYVEGSNGHAVLLALNNVEKGNTVPLSALYGEDFDPETRFVWSFKEQRYNDEKFFTVTLVPAKSNQIEKSFALTEEVYAKKIFCAEYLTKLRTTTRVTNGENDTLTSLFSENQIVTALYACHLSM